MLNLGVAELAKRFGDLDEPTGIYLLYFWNVVHQQEYCVKERGMFPW